MLKQHLYFNYKEFNLICDGATTCLNKNNSHITALSGSLLDQHLWCLPFFYAGIISLSGCLVLPHVDPMQAPKLGSELLTDQYAAGTNVSMDKIFAVEELLNRQEDGDFRIKYTNHIIHAINADLK